MSYTSILYAVVLAGVLFLTGALGLTESLAADSQQTINELQDKISNKISKIEETKKEIEVFQNDLNKVGREKTSSQRAINTLDISA